MWHKVVQNTVAKNKIEVAQLGRVISKKVHFLKPYICDVMGRAGLMKKNIADIYANYLCSSAAGDGSSGLPGAAADFKNAIGSSSLRLCYEPLVAPLCSVARRTRASEQLVKPSFVLH